MEKMFVLIRQDLKSVAYKAVQGGHALAQYLLDYPDNCWRNQNLVYLCVKDEQTLKMWEYKLKDNNMTYSKFYEPDINNELTAIAISTSNVKVFKNLELLN